MHRTCQPYFDPGRTGFTFMVMNRTNLRTCMLIGTIFPPSSGLIQLPWQEILALMPESLACCGKQWKRIRLNCWRLGMGILALGADERVADVAFTADSLSVTLKDGRTIAVPLAWYPRLFQATPQQRKHWE